MRKTDVSVKDFLTFLQQSIRMSFAIGIINRSGGGVGSGLAYGIEVFGAAVNGGRVVIGPPLKPGYVLMSLTS